MPKIVVKFFGPARDSIDTEQIPLEIDDGQTLERVADILTEKYPKLGAVFGIRLAVNRSYAALDYVLAEGDEVAVIPPVSGGSQRPKAWLTREPIDVGRHLEALRRDDAGALATFIGTVRAESADGQPLVALEYHAYEEMALSQLQFIRDEAIKCYDILDALIVHRLGRLSLGEVSIAVLVVSAHREAAFNACQWIIDEVKEDVPIWKKDLWSDGSANWVDWTCS